MEQAVHQVYGNRVRLRICGICVQDDAILLVNHRGLAKGDFWSPPGGGLEFGESMEDCLRREFIEETGLETQIEEFLFVCEFVRPPLHAIELFFSVKPIGGQLKLGSDPESGANQLIQSVRFVAFGEVENISPDQLHGIFRKTPNIRQIDLLRGHFKL